MPNMGSDDEFSIDLINKLNIIIGACLAGTLCSIYVIMKLQLFND